MLKLSLRNHRAISQLYEMEAISGVDQSELIRQAINTIYELLQDFNDDEFKEIILDNQKEAIKAGQVQTKKSPELGRPPITDGSEKACILSIRITATEKQALEALAVQKGISLSEFVRQRLLSAIEAESGPPQ